MKNIVDFIKACTDAWHTTAEIGAELSSLGYTALDEGEEWSLAPGGKYYTTRNMSSIIAFKIPCASVRSFMISAAHGESPSFKIKAVPELNDGNYTRLNVEAYGGMNLATWLDRPLSVSGRAVIENGDRLETRLVRLDRDSLIIPSLAIHLNRDSKDSAGINILRDMPPMYAANGAEADFLKEIAEAANVCKEQIKGFDLMLYNREEGRIWGKNDEFISAPRLDDLQCVYALLKGFIDGENSDTAQVFCVFDNEEVGSGTKQGAKSDFLCSALCRISEALGKTDNERLRMLRSSFLVSADNGHAVHPNRCDVSDSVCHPKLNGGIVIKYNAAQRYTTDAVSEAVFKKICATADVPYQVYANRSDIAGGSTLGNLAAERTSINAVDVGLAQLAMHSAFETAGNTDTGYLIRAMRTFYSSRLTCTDGCICIEI